MMKNIYRNNIIDSIHYYKIFTFIIANLIVGGGNLIGLSGDKPVAYSIAINTAYNAVVILLSVIRYRYIKCLDFC